MGISIVILSPLAETRTNKAVADCCARVESLGLVAPELKVLPEHDQPEVLAAMLEEDPDLIERAGKTESVIAIHSETKLSQDPAFVECLRFLFRRSGDALVQFPDGVAEIAIALALIASMEGIEDFDERDEARKVHARLLQTKYRLLTKRWVDGDVSFAPRALTNIEIEQAERRWRLSFPTEFRAYLAIVGVGPGPSNTGLPMLDELGKPKTYKKAGERPKLGKAIQLGKYDEDNAHLLICDGPVAGTVWGLVDGEPSAEPIAPSFIEYIESWIGSGPPEPILCSACRIPLEVQDLEREFCQSCGQRRSESSGERSEASRAFEVLAKALVEELVEQEFLEIEEPEMLSPLVAALTDYMSEKGHKWKSPDRAAASIAGWLMHRDEVAELHGTNSDVARVFVAVGKNAAA